jgi:threonine dehydrogenase-like Zn-dependent dehydrogenase
MQTKSFWHTSKKSSEIRTQNLEISSIENPIIIKSAYSAISLGTEKLVALGNIPTEMFAKMKVPYMSGDFNFPVKYGYSLVGQTPENNWVHVMHPHQNCEIVNSEDCYFLSDKTDLLVATQISNLETIVNAIWTSKVKANDRVLVCGTGSIGVLLAKTVKEYCKANVFVEENNPVKREKLVDFGFQLCNTKTDYDICFNVSASENGLQYCIDHCTTEGKIIELSWYGNKPVLLQLGGNFHYKRLQIISSQVSEIPIEMEKDFDFLSRKKLVEKLINLVDYKPLISNIIEFEKLPEFFEKIRKNQPNNDFITVVKY